MTRPRAHWTGRSNPLIVQAAEALGVTTDLVMAVARAPGAAFGHIYLALYSPFAAEPERIARAWLARDDDGILRLRGKPEEVPGFAGWVGNATNARINSGATLEGLREEIERKLGELDAEGGLDAPA
jgi:hypothetical protein